MITEIIRERIFALYWGQEILRNPGNQRTLFYNRPVPGRWNNTAFLQLKPLSTISHEDAMQVLEYFHQYSPTTLYKSEMVRDTDRYWKRFYYETNEDNGFEGIDNIKVVANFTDEGLHAINANRDEIYWKALDFLRYRGYAMPAFGYSVSQLVEYGVFSLTQ